MKNLFAVAAFSIQAVSPQSLGLGTSVSVDLQLEAGPEFQGTVELSVDTASLASQDPARDISFAFTPAKIAFKPGESASTKLKITTRTSAPSFAAADGKLNVVARSRSTVVANTEIQLGVEPVYVVNVVQKREGKCEDNKRVTDRVSWICDFDSPPETAYFRSHDRVATESLQKGLMTKGLLIKFVNQTQDKFFIHGSDAIMHMPTSDSTGRRADKLVYGQEYSVTIPPTTADQKGADQKGSYTLHDIYRPSRDTIFNATRIPAAPAAR